MSLEPLFEAGAIITVHALAAVAAFLIGGVQLCLPKGTRLHRTVGYTWVGLMVIVAVSALFIYTIRLIGPFSPIHALVPYTLFSLGYGVLAARQGRIDAHKRAMVQTYAGALLIAGVFTLWPGRIMHQVVFG